MDNFRRVGSARWVVDVLTAPDRIRTASVLSTFGATSYPLTTKPSVSRSWGPRRILMALLIIVSIVLVVPSVAHGASSATYYWLYDGCYGPTVDCWSTDTAPAAGDFGDAMQHDVITSLPTNGLGAPGITTGPISQSHFGGDFALGTSTDVHGVPSMTASTDSQGVWHLQMGAPGANDCYTGGNPCNLEVNSYLWGANAAMETVSFGDRPWSSQFSHPVFYLSTDQTLGPWGGRFHGFLCADLINVNSKESIEDCAETWNPVGATYWFNTPTLLICGALSYGSPSQLDWTHLGYDGNDTYISSGETPELFGNAFQNDVAPYGLAIDRRQLAASAVQCGGSVGNYDDWAVMWIENGYEGGGSNAYLGFKVSNTVASTESDTLYDGEKLLAGESLWSPTGTYRLTMQDDGNLVLYDGPSAIWSSGTLGHSGAYAVLQNDGNFVVYQGGAALWASHSSGSVTKLILQDDGNLVIYQGETGSPLWSSGTSGRAAAEPEPKPVLPRGFNPLRGISTGSS